jgi:uncharacterized membrane protein
MATPAPPQHARAPMHPRFIGAGAVPLIAALGTDAMYYKTSVWQWANFSAWLITAGLILALVATLFLVVDFVTGRAGRVSWLTFGLVAAAALLSVVNIMVHSRDAWTSVVPEGIILSAIVAILLLISALWGWRLTEARTTARGDRA